MTLPLVFWPSRAIALPAEQPTSTLSSPAPTQMGDEPLAQSRTSSARSCVNSAQALLPLSSDPVKVEIEALEPPARPCDSPALLPVRVLAPQVPAQLIGQATPKPRVVSLPREHTDFQVAEAPTPLEKPEPTPESEESTAEPLGEPEANSRPYKYGRNGQGRWYIQGGTGINYNPAAANFFGLAGAGITHFFADGHSISAELNAMGFNQEGSDAVGLNLGVIARWHFYRQRAWSLYIDGGVGILGTTGSVPPAGTRFNFTPQVGGGASVRLAKQRRLLLGLRWHHISNANLFDNNPGQDAVFGYVGLELPR